MAQDFQIIAAGEISLDYDKVIYGIKRLAQKFLMELLTVRGSMRYLPNQGCNFLKRLRKHAISEFDVAAAFAAARSQIRSTLRSEETEYTLPEERFADATLDHTFVMSDGLRFSITVRNKAGKSINIVTPLIELQE